MAVTLKNVAELAGVSTATVSRVLNNDIRIRDKTRTKVLDSIQALGYTMNNVARSLKTNRTRTIGFVCPELTNGFFMQVGKGVEDELRKYGYSMIFCNSNDTIAGEIQRFRLLAEQCVDGVILIPSSPEGSHLAAFHASNIPIVLVDRTVENFQADAVLVDNVNGSYAAVEYLLGKGKSRIAYIGGDRKLINARERDEGYRRAMADYRIPVDETLVKYGDFHVESGFQLMAVLMQQDNPPEDIFIANYFMYLGAAKYLVAHKNELQRPVWLASFDDMEYSSIFGSTSVTVIQPMLELGQQAAQLLMKRIAGDRDNFPQLIRLKTTLNYP